MSARVVGRPRVIAELGVKRFYLPGVAVESACQMCGAANKTDLGAHYLSYPSIGEPTEVRHLCERCDHSWTTSVVLRLSVRLAS